MKPCCWGAKPVRNAGIAVAAPAHYWIGGLIVAGAVLGLGLWPVVLFRRSGQSENPWKPTPAYWVMRPIVAPEWSRALPSEETATA